MTFDGGEVWYVVSWSIDEGDPVVFGTNARITGQIEVIFDEATNHSIKRGSRTDISIFPSENSSAYPLPDSKVVSRSIGSGVDQLIKATINFQVDGELIFS